MLPATAATGKTANSSLSVVTRDESCVLVRFLLVVVRTNGGASHDGTREARYQDRSEGRTPRVDRPCGDRPALSAVLDGSHGVEPRGAEAQRDAAAQQLSTVVAHRYLRLPRGRLADHDGNARRPNRPPSTVTDWRRGLRGRIGVRSILAERGDAHRHARASRTRGRNARALDAFAYPQPVPRPAAASGRRCVVDHQLFGWRCDRPADRRHAARALLVGLGIL